MSYIETCIHEKYMEEKKNVVDVAFAQLVSGMGDIDKIANRFERNLSNLKFKYATRKRVRELNEIHGTNLNIVYGVIKNV